MSERIANREVRRNKRIDSPDIVKKKENQKRKKIALWIKTLPADKQKFIAEFTDIECNKAKDRYSEQISDSIDRTLTAAMIEVTDYSLEEINRIQITLTSFMLEDNEKVRELKRIAGGDWMKAAEKYKEQVVERSLELIKKGVTDKEAKDTLVIEFPKLSRAMITNAYKKVKEKTKEVVEAVQSLKEETKVIEEKVDPEVQKAMEHIFGKEEVQNNNKKMEKKMVKKAVKETVEEFKETVKIEGINKEIVVPNISPSNIEVVCLKIVKELEANTEFGQVIAKSGEGIKFKTSETEILFKNKEQLESFYNVGKKIFEMI